MRDTLSLQITTKAVTNNTTVPQPECVSLPALIASHLLHDSQLAEKMEDTDD